MSQLTAPFKFLDSYKQEDNDIFFGREKETNDLYQALSGVKHLLVYGPSGAGKTSLVECGLRNQFSDADWFALTIRRGADIAVSVFSEINKALREKMDLDPETKLPLDPETDFGQAIEQLFSERYQPVYLLFDQFEELLISGSNAEKRDFFTRLNQLIRYKVPCRVMLIMREEFIGHLSEFELLCPSIFQHRFRLEKMRKENVKEVIRETLDAPHYRPFFRVEDSAQLAESILGKLPDMSREIELTHVQVFLNELWQRAKAETSEDALPLLGQGLVEEKDSLEGVLDSFLKTQLRALAPDFGDQVPLELLAAMITERRTKLQMAEADLKRDLDEKAVRFDFSLIRLLHELERRRILRKIKSGEQTQYELSHDVLAAVVGNNFTKEMEFRYKAADIYKVYAEKTGWLTQDDLDLLRPYRDYRPYAAELESRILDSEAHWQQEVLRKEQEIAEQLASAKAQAEKEARLREEAEAQKNNAEMSQRRATWFAWGAVFLTMLVALAFFYAQLQSKIAKESASKAESARIISDSNAVVANSEKNRADIALSYAKGNAKIAVATLLSVAEKAIQQVNYEEALQSINAAVRLNENKPEVANALFEIAFVHNYAGDWKRAKIETAQVARLLDKSSLALEAENAKAGYTLKTLRKLQEKLAPSRFKEMDVRYFPTMVEVRGGIFTMGNKLKGQRVHNQELSDFKIAGTETTVFQYNLFCLAKKSTIAQRLVEDSPGTEYSRDNYTPSWGWSGIHPVVNVSWFDAVFYANWASVQKGYKPVYTIIDNTDMDTDDRNGIYKVSWLDTFANGYRLPSEAEWEYAAKGGKHPDNSLYAGDFELGEVAWHYYNSSSSPHPVATKKKNGADLYDMSGNVSEWCWDWFDDYEQNPCKDYKGPKNGESRVWRGGSWQDLYDSYPEVDSRDEHDPFYRTEDLGFRLARYFK